MKKKSIKKITRTNLDLRPVLCRDLDQIDSNIKKKNA